MSRGNDNITLQETFIPKVLIQLVGNVDVYQLHL